MTQAEFPPDWLKASPELSRIHDHSWQQAIRTTKLHHFEAGDIVYNEGELCHAFIIVIAGQIRLQRVSDEGHEITLHHLKPGDTCRLSAACVLAGKRHQAEAISETPATIAFMPAKHFNQAITDSEPLRQYLFRSLDSSLSALVTLVDELAFGDLDRRLAKYLLTLCTDSPYIPITHQQLANELGTAREVISRILKTFETKGYLHRTRGHIEIKDHDALAQINTEKE